MKISFDLDDTLILSGKNAFYEPPIKFPYSIFYRECLRKQGDGSLASLTSFWVIALENI
jgi:hypothetical protein